MNYSIRNLALWRWVNVVLWGTLAVSLFLTFVKSWGWEISVEPLWLIPERFPAWSVFPITATLFVATFVWMETGLIAMGVLKRGRGWLATVIKASVMGIFCGTYSLPFIIIGSLIMSAITRAYFKGDKEYNRASQNYRGSEQILYYLVLVGIYVGNCLWFTPEKKQLLLDDMTAAQANLPSLMMVAMFIAVAMLLITASAWAFREAKQPNSRVKAFGSSISRALTIVWAFIVWVTLICVGLAMAMYEWSVDKYQQTKKWLLPAFSN